MEKKPEIKQEEKKRRQGITATDKQREAYYEVIKQQKSEEVSLEMPTGLKVAAKVWGPVDSETRVLAVHGWLDNANSFDLIAPFLASNRMRVVCIDLIGHGKTISKPLWCDYFFIDYLTMIMDVAECLGWKRFSYLGHSLGAGIGSVLVSALPECFEKLVLIDSLGPMSKDNMVLDTISIALRERDRMLARQPLIYPTREKAFSKYKRNNPFISEVGANLLLERGMQNVVNPVGKVGFRFRHDPRLVGNSSVRFQEEDVLHMLGAIQCPVLLILASSSSEQYKEMKKSENVAKFKARVAAVKEMKILNIEGSHHVHLDNPEAFGQQVVDFLLLPSEKENPDVEKCKAAENEKANLQKPMAKL